ncbi:hypothetical protein [Martelella sp. HB161492]|uniref:hypothetical protein n=1 Tax=Martelella sp. HB161492 TaxID=2720726 RepID=UPI00159068DE|nr:hypothetical protein [Martelella sp. HB161492]
MVDWVTVEALTEESCAGIFDTVDLTLQPRAKVLTVNHPPQDDPDRATFSFVGSIELEPPMEVIARHKPADPKAGPSVAYDAVLTALISDWPYQPKRNDRVIVDATGEVYKIAAKIADGGSRPAWFLMKEVERAGS